MAMGYEQIYAGLCARLAACDLHEAAGRLGMGFLSGSHASLSFLGRVFIISPGGVKPAQGTAPLNTRSVLAYYALSPGMSVAAGT